MNPDATFYGRVDLQGRLLFPRPERIRHDARIVALTGKNVVITVEEESALLSARQRRWYFGQILGRIEGHTGQPADDLHLYYKRRFLGAHENRLIVLVDGNGNALDEQTCVVTPTLTVLGTKRMAQYCDEIRNTAAVEIPLHIPEPDPDYRTAK